MESCDQILLLVRAVTEGRGKEVIAALEKVVMECSGQNPERGRSSTSACPKLIERNIYIIWFAFLNRG